MDNITNATPSPSLADSGVLRDITAPYVNKMKQQADLEAQVEQNGSYDMAMRGIQNSALGSFTARIVGEFQHRDETPDEAFQASLPAQVIKDHPSASHSEREFLSAAVNQDDYTWRRELLEKHTSDSKLLQGSYTGTLAGLAVDVAPDIIAGMGIVSGVGRMAAGAARIGTAFGANAAQGAASEYLRQKASLDDVNMRSVLLSAMVSGGLGSVFDGVVGAKLADARDAAGAATKGIAGTKPLSHIEADAVGSAVAPHAVDTATADIAAKTISDTVPVVARQVSSGLDADAIAAIKANAAKHIETLDAARAAHTAADEFPDTAFSQAFQRAQATLEAKVAKAEAVQATKADISAGANTVDSTAVTQAADSALSPRVLDIEASVPSSMTSGRLVLTENNGAVFKPVFESPIDRAMATVGSQTTEHGASVEALDVLRRAFPKETDESLVNMSDNFVEQHLMPTLRAGGAPDAKVPRWWDKMDPKGFRSAEEHIEAADFPAAQQWANTAPATPADIVAVDVPTLGADVARQALSDAADKATKLVTIEEVTNGFTKMSKVAALRPLAANLKSRVDAFEKAFGKKPDLHQVRAWAGQEMYNRAMFDAQRALSATAGKVGSKVSPIVGKALMVTGGAVVLSLVVASSAYAGGGGAVAGDAGAAALVGLLVGGKFLKKALSQSGKGAALAAKLAEAQKMQRAFAKSGSTDSTAVAAHEAAVEAKTGLKLVNGEVHFKGTAAELKECLDTTGMSAEQADQLIVSMKAVDSATGKPLEVVPHFDGDKVLKSVQDMDQAPLIKTIATVGNKLVRVRTPGFASEIRADFQRLADDASQTMRGLAHFVANPTIGRTGKVANEMTADVLFNKSSVEYASKTTTVLKDGVKAWRQETGAKAPALWNMRAQGLEQAQFDREVARAWRVPGDPQVSQAARDAAGKMRKLQDEVITEAQRARSFMEGKGIKLKEDDPVRLFSEMKPGDQGFPRFLNKTAVKNVVSQIGEDGVKQLLSKALRVAGTGVPDVHVEAVSQRIYDALFAEKDNFGAFMTKPNGQQLSRELRAAGVPEGVVEDVKTLFGMSEMGKAGQAKLKLDLDTALDFTVDGKVVSFKLADLYEQNASAVFSRWSRSGIGAVSMALPGAAHGVNLADDAQWALLMRKARSEGAGDYSIQALQAYRERVLGYGKDADVFGNPGTIGRTMRGLANYWMGSDFLFAQIGDAGSMGPRIVTKFIRSVPSLMKLNKGILNGTVGLEELQHLRSMTGAGLESTSASVSNLANGIDATANFVDQLGHFQRKFSGMGFFGDSMSVLAAKDMQDNLLKYAFTGQIDARLWKHYAVYGIDKATADSMVPMLKDAAQGFDSGTFSGVSKEALQAFDFNLAKRYEMALFKRGKSVNGETAGWGEGARWFRASEAGQFVHQLQGAALLVTQRTQRDLANFDGLVAQAWVSSFGFAMASYLAKTGISFYNNQAELEKRLSPAELFKAAVRGSSFSGIWPNLVDAGLTYGLQRDPLFSNAAGGKTGAGEVAFQGGIKKPIAAIGGIMGLISGKENDRYTAAELRALKASTLNVWWLNPAVAFMAADMPQGNDPATKK